MLRFFLRLHLRLRLRLGGPQNHQIGALAVALKQVMTPGLKEYAKQVKANAVAIDQYLIGKGYKLVTGGTENHLVLSDLRPLGLTGNKVEKLCDLCNITVNKNPVFGDNSALAPGGVRVANMLAWAVRDYGHIALKELERLKGCKEVKECSGVEGALCVSLECFVSFLQILYH